MRMKMKSQMLKRKEKKNLTVERKQMHRLRMMEKKRRATKVNWMTWKTIRLR